MRLILLEFAEKDVDPAVLDVIATLRQYGLITVRSVTGGVANTLATLVDTEVDQHGEVWFD